MQESLRKKASNSLDLRMPRYQVRFSQDVINLSSPGCSGARTNRRVRAYTIFLKKVTTSTYQADQNEKNKCYFSEDRPARYVAVACERKGCAFMQIKQPSSTYLLWTLWPWENRHSPSMQDHAPRPLGNNWQNREGRRYFQATNKNKGDEKGLSQWMVNAHAYLLNLYYLYYSNQKTHF